jgi:hypothetical protein
LVSGRARSCKSGIVPPSLGAYDHPEEAAALVALLTRHATLIEHIELDLICERRRCFDELETFLLRGAEEGRLLDPTHPFLPAIHSIRSYTPVTAPDLRLTVPSLAESLETLVCELDSHRGPDYDGPLGLHAGLFSDFRRLRSLTLDGMWEGEFTLNANVLGLSTLTNIVFAFDLTEAEILRLEDPEGWLDRPAASLLPNLESATLRVSCRPATLFSPLIPHLCHTTRLNLMFDGLFTALQPALPLFTRLKDLEMVFGRDSSLLDANNLFSLPLPKTVESLSIMFNDPSSNLAITVPAAFFSQLPSLAYVELCTWGEHNGLIFDPVATDLLTLRRATIWTEKINRDKVDILPVLRRCPNLEILSVWREGEEIRWASGRTDVDALLKKLEEEKEKE